MSCSASGQIDTKDKQKKNIYIPYSSFFYIHFSEKKEKL